ncbi:MAG: sensor histidine kinase [Cytophagales bacterium]|nr:sensor histidine kinase [Cytophagales bacterium]
MNTSLINKAQQIVLAISLMACSVANSQSPSDSLLRILKQLPDDTAKVMLYYQYGELFETTNPDSALWYYDLARKKSQDLNYLKGQAAYASNAIVILNNRGKFKEALGFAKEALSFYQQIGTKKDLAVANINVGSEWQYLSDFETAAKSYFEALKLAEEIGDKRLQRISNNNLASIFIELGQYEKGKGYAEKSLVLATELKNDYAIASSTYNIANAEIYLKQYDKALNHFKDIEANGIRTNDYIVILDGWLGQADVYKMIPEYSQAEFYFKKVISFSIEKEAPEYEMYAQMGLADVYTATNKNQLATQALTRGIALASELGSVNELRDLYNKAAVLYENTGKDVNALDFRKKFEVLNDSIVGEKSRANINMLEARYESEKKEQQIRDLKQQAEIKDLSIQQNRLLIIILVAVLISVVAIAWLGRRTYNQKKLLLEKDNALKQSRIAELEAEKQLLASEAVIKGQEEERGRLAKDLHDGLGGLLSGVKFSLTNMKSNVVLDAQSALVFERSLDMLDNSISELRRVAHNMMPEVLVKFGLQEALKSYCDSIEQSGIFKVGFQSLGTDVRLTSNTEIILYRIVQELLNNASKYAKASMVLVQLAFHENEISITVEDNGVGFDIAKTQHSTGAGWTNIRSRVEYLKGKVDVTSGTGGTSVHLYVPI